MAIEEGKKSKLEEYTIPIIIIIVIAAAIIIYAANSVTTTVYLSSNDSNVTPTLFGDGAHNLSIQVSAIDELKLPVNGGLVNATATIGTVQSCVTTNGVCTIIYSAPQVSHPETATIYISYGSVKEKINVKITPDSPTSILLQPNKTNATAYTNSRIKYTVEAFDDVGKAMPNNTRVNFSFTGNGRLPYNWCITVDGSCNTTLYTQQTPGTLTMTATSGNASASSKLTVMQNILYTFGNTTNSTSIAFCVSPSNVFTSGQAYLNEGQDIQWTFNQTLPSTSTMVLLNQQSFEAFNAAVSNASIQYSLFTGCNPSIVQSAATYRFCINYYNRYKVSASSLYVYPYLDIQNSLKNYSPVLYSIPGNSYVQSLNFTPSVSGNYTFVVFASAMQFPSYLTVPLSSATQPFPPSPECYSNSYVAIKT